jgi:hypothetical protein
MEIQELLLYLVCSWPTPRRGLPPRFLKSLLSFETSLHAGNSTSLRPMSSLTNKIAIFIDGPNLCSTSKTPGFDADFRRLLSEFGSRGKLFRSFYYAAVIED